MSQDLDNHSQSKKGAEAPFLINQIEKFHFL